MAHPLARPLLIALAAHTAGLLAVFAGVPRIPLGVSEGVPALRVKLIDTARPQPLHLAVPDAVQREEVHSAMSTEGQVNSSITLPPSAAQGEAEEPTQALSAGIVDASAVPVEGDPEWADYLPRSKLTQAPQALGSLQVPFPAVGIGAVDLKLTLTAYIDEFGEVREVRVDAGPVAPEFAEAARSAFSRARFTPGLIGDIPVRSRLRAEVSFSNTPG